MAAVILNAATGGDFSAEHVLNSDCPRLKINGRFLFGDADIIALAERLLTESPVLNPQPYPSVATSSLQATSRHPKNETPQRPSGPPNRHSIENLGNASVIAERAPKEVQNG
jgi:hypothetical protein